MSTSVFLNIVLRLNDNTKRKATRLNDTTLTLNDSRETQ